MAGADAICIIPARGGSRRIPGKNIRLFGGLPLIAHSIRAALQSGVFARVIVSTDDPAIASIAREHGAETPFTRDAALSDDHATTADALRDAIIRSGETARVLTCCLYATAPLVEAADFRSARATLIARSADCVLCVTHFDFPPQRALQAGKDGSLAFAYPEYELTRSQDLPEQVHDAGMFYLLDTASFLERGRILGGRTFGHFIPRMRAVDIDTPEDLEFAEILFERRAKFSA